MKALASKAEALLVAFREELESEDPAYFAPFLRHQANRNLLDEWVGELASWEWALHHAGLAAGSCENESSEFLAVSESVSLVHLKWNVFDWIEQKKQPTKKEQLLKIWFDLESQKPMAETISLPEAYVLDSLREGPVSVEDVTVQMTSRGLNFELVSQMKARGIVKFVRKTDERTF